MAAYDDDSDVDSEEEEEIKKAINAIPTENRFNFTPVKCPVLDNLKEQFPDSIETFNKWGLLKKMRFLDYHFDKPLHAHQKRDFVMSFFLSKKVKPTLMTNRDPGSFDIMSLAYAIDGLDIEDISCNILNMEFFDRLWVRGVVRDGEMVKSKPDRWGDVPCSDDVRKMLLLKYNDNYDLFDEDERSEFIFRIFMHVTLGGDSEQFEYEVGPYLHTARIFYKQFVSVIKDQNTGAQFVDSSVFKVDAKMGEYMVFPDTCGSQQSYCYFIVDNRRKLLRLWYNARY